MQTDVQLHVKAHTRTHTEIKSQDAISRAIASGSNIYIKTDCCYLMYNTEHQRK